jgi:hypothetical protein
MDDAFTQALAEWTGFYALMGGAAATLLGLLFVAVSLRLNIFHQREVADVRDFAAFTLGSFLMAIAVAALALAPHGRRGSLALALAFAGVGGLLAAGWVARDWIRLNPRPTEARPGFTPGEWQGVAYMLAMIGPYIGLLAVAVLLWREHAGALGWLAVVEGWLLTMGTVAAWVMLSHAGGGQDADAAGD